MPDAPTLPGRWVNPADWQGQQIPVQEWTVHGVIPVRQVCLFSGHGGAGKSTLGLHLCAAHAIGRPWLNYGVEMGPAFFLDAEDDLDVIHRRCVSVAQHYGCQLADMSDLMIMPLTELQSTLLAYADRGRIHPTPLYERIYADAKELRPKQIVIASSANVFGGEERDRAQVTQFIGLLTHLAVVTGGSVVLISHPSLAGLNSGSGISGSTSWHNAVRAQMNLTVADEIRKLEFKKNQYGPASGELALEWRDGLLLPLYHGGVSDYERAHQNHKADALFRELLHEQIDQYHARLSPHASAPSTYAPAVMVASGKTNGIGKRELEDAMRRLIDRREIVVLEDGPPSKRRSFIGFPPVS